MNDAPRSTSSLKKSSSTWTPRSSAAPDAGKQTPAPFPEQFSGPLQYGAGIKAYVLNLLIAQMLSLERVQQSMEAIGIIPRYGGVIIHDCWASYLAYDHCGHGLCGAHLLRELTFIVDADGYAWAANMKRLLQQTCRRVSRRKRKKLSPREYANLQKRYRNILTRGAKELPPIPPKHNGKCGRVAKSDAATDGLTTARTARKWAPLDFRPSLLSLPSQCCLVRIWR